MPSEQLTRNPQCDGDFSAPARKCKKSQTCGKKVSWSWPMWTLKTWLNDLDYEVARSSAMCMWRTLSCIRQPEDGTKIIEFRKGPTKTRSVSLSIRQITKLQVMYSTVCRKTDPVHLFKLWLSQWPEGTKDIRTLYHQNSNGTNKASSWNWLPVSRIIGSHGVKTEEFWSNFVMMTSIVCLSYNRS